MPICIECGRDLTGRRPNIIYCSNRCRHRQRTAAQGRPGRRNTNKALGRPKAMWPRFLQVAGPPMSARQLHWATVSDRDPRTGRSAWEDAEERSRSRT